MERISSLRVFKKLGPGGDAPSAQGHSPTLGTTTGSAPSTPARNPNSRFQTGLASEEHLAFSEPLPLCPLTSPARGLSHPSSPLAPTRKLGIIIPTSQGRKLRPRAKQNLPGSCKTYGSLQIPSIVPLVLPWGGDRHRAVGKLWGGYGHTHPKCVCMETGHGASGRGPSLMLRSCPSFSLGLENILYKA